MELFRPILIGLLATIFGLLPRTLHEIWPVLNSKAPFAWSVSLVLLLALAWVQRLGARQSEIASLPGEGTADLIRYLHTPGDRVSPLVVFGRAFSSFILAVAGWGAGSEGATVELTRAVQSISRRGRSIWSDPHRRTEVSIALVAGMAAAFASPWAGLALVAELSMGGRLTALILTALSAAFFGKWFTAAGWLSAVEIDPGSGIFGFRMNSPREWFAAVAIGIVAGLFGALLVRFFRAAKEHLRGLGRHDVLGAAIVGGIGIILVREWSGSTLEFSSGLEGLLWLRIEDARLLYWLLAEVLVVAFLHAGFGTVGILAPVFLVGALTGTWIDHIGLHALPGALSVAPLVGGAAIFGVVFGAPLTGCVIAWGIAGNATVLLPVLVASQLALWVRRALGTSSLIEEDLHDRGLRLVRGKSIAVMERLRIKDAMAKDFLTFMEHEHVSELRAKVQVSPYAFFPVVDGRSKYLGMLSLDLLENVWEAAQVPDANPQLDRLLEARDLLYRAGGKTPAVQMSQKLISADSLLDDHPCVAVLDEESKVVGLLFAHQIRVFYDREANRERFTRT